MTIELKEMKAADAGQAVQARKVEGGMVGLYNEMTYFNGVHETR